MNLTAFWCFSDDSIEKELIEVDYEDIKPLRKILDDNMGKSM